MKKQGKKFVLAALALLAITGLLALAGCKNDTVPEPTRYTVKFNKNAEDASGEMQSQIFTEGVEQELSANQFRRDTYTFSGWSEDKAATAPTYKDKAKFKATKDTTLYAVWTDNGTVASVAFSPPTGTKFYCDESIAVSLTSEEGATIQYKLGDQNWQDYDAGSKIQVTGDTTITAKATKEGLKPSETTATYTVRKLEGITVTSPTRTVYSERQSFDPTGMVVTATYDDKSQREVTGWETDFNTVAGEKGLNKPVTVSYTEGETPKEATFTVDVVNVEEPTKLTTYTSPNNPDDSWTYMAFGEWPQTIKDASVNVYETKSKQMGMFTYYLGSDDNYYVKITAKPYKDIYTYSDGNPVEKDKEVYFKVEPIVWRVLNKDYASTGKALLLAESILTGGVHYYVSSYAREITKETETEKVTVYPNNWQYSTIRAWLNGSYEANDPQAKEYAGKGFLQTAFTESAQKLIADTSVDNSAASTIPSGINTEALKSDWNDGVNPYASDTPTKDKIFLLSEEEATTSEYDFDEYNKYAGDGTTLTSTRIRVTTDYAKATGANQSSTEGYGGWWWLRSPTYDVRDIARGLDDGGYAGNNCRYFVNLTDWGVVPALSISLQ